MIEDMIESADEELKRADHLINVSIKISKTGDVIKNAIDRLVSTYEVSFTEILEFLEEKRLIKEIPKSIRQRVKMVKDKIEKGQFNKFIRHYNTMKKVSMADCKSIGEFRKGLTLITKGKREIHVDIPKLQEWYRETKVARKYMVDWTKEKWQE